jgi:hypothetical protein
MFNYVVKVAMDNERHYCFGIAAKDEPAAIVGVLSNMTKLHPKKFVRIVEVIQLFDFIGEMA